MTDVDKAGETYQDFIKAGVLEDRFEYDIEELVLSNPDLSPEAVTILYGMIQSNMYVPGPNLDPDPRGSYKGIREVEVLEIPPQDLHDLIEGALIDCSLEGWDSYQQVTIKAFLKDLVLAHRLS